MNSNQISLTCIIVDDEKNARLSLRGLLEEEFPTVKILAEAKDIPETVRQIIALKPDVVFLDIEMPGYSGLSLLDFFEKDALHFKIIFVTAYNEYAINAFELSAVDYILKPARKNQIEKALNRVVSQNNSNLILLKNNIDPSAKKKIAVSTSDGVEIIPIDEIIYIKAEGSYSQIFRKNNQKIMVSKKLLEFEKLEQSGKFLRVHRSSIVNLQEIIKINRITDGTIRMSNNVEISVASDKRETLMNLIGNDTF